MRRIIDLWVFDPSKLRFKTNEERSNFLEAVGYAVMFGTFGRNQDDNTTGVVNIGIDQDLEISVAHFQAEEYKSEETYDKHRKFYRVDEALDGFRQPEHRPPFVMGGIPRKNGDDPATWEWHS